MSETLELVCGAPRETIDEFMRAAGYVPAVTELTELNAEKVAAVKAPANGVPFLAMKSSSQEADGVLRAVTGEADDNGPDRHPATGRFLSGEDSSRLSVEELRQAEQELERATDPDERDRLSQQVTVGRLRQLYEGNHPEKGVPKMATATKSAVNLPAAIRRLEQLHPKLPPGRLREEVGETLTKCRIEALHAAKSAQKTRAGAERAAADASIRAAQASALSPAPKQRTSNPKAVLQSVYDATVAAQRTGVARREGAVEVYDAHGEPDPLVVAGQVEDELKDAIDRGADTATKARISEDLTVARLKALYAARDGLAPARGVAKAKLGKKAAKKAAKRRARIGAWR